MTKLASRVLILLALLGSLGAVELTAAERFQSVPPPASLAASPAGVPEGSYILTPDDELHVKVWREDDLETKTKVDRDGSVSLPLIGNVSIGGKTVVEVTKLIASLYEKDYLVDPQVTLTVTASTNKIATARVAVLGQVKKAGFHEIPLGRKTISLLEAIALAEGFTRLAKSWEVNVKRTEDGKERVYLIDADKLMSQPKLKAFDVLPGDSIFVPERFF